MTDPKPTSHSEAEKSSTATAASAVAPTIKRQWWQIRRPITALTTAVAGALAILLCFGVWWYLTRGATAEDRVISPTMLPSPAETWDTIGSLFGERNLVANTWVTLRRVALGFALAAVVGVPLGVLAGCFPAISAFLAPVVIFGRNIPIAALIPLTFFFFGIGENQKVLFIFLACVAFVVSDTSNSIRNVSQAYIDTAYTLGAGRRQVIMKVLVPLAMPSIFESLRLLFGLAFGYIMLAETIKFGNEAGGLGNLISLSQRQGPRTHIILIILIIPVVALAIDQLLFWIQRQLFPFRHGGAGWLQKIWTMLMHQWENVKSIMFQTRPPFDQVVREYEIEQAAGKRPKFAPGAISNAANNKEWRP